MRRVRGKRIAMVLQDPMTSLNPALTIGAQIGEVVRLHQGLRGPSLKARVLRALSRLRIPGGAARLDQYQHQFSGGMRQRVTSAIAMSCEPRLLIADEPTTSLDVTIQAQYLELLKEVQAESGVAVILVTHDFGIVAANADRVAVMYAGKIVEMGSTLQVFEPPLIPTPKRCCGASRTSSSSASGSSRSAVSRRPRRSAGCPSLPLSQAPALCDETFRPPCSFGTTPAHAGWRERPT